MGALPAAVRPEIAPRSPYNIFSMQPWMKSREWLVTVILFLLVLATVVASILTRDFSTAATSTSPGHHPPIVDEKPLQTARDISKLAAGWDEMRYANTALRLGDHEVDLAFADALRDAANHPAPVTLQNKELFTRVSQTQAVLKADQERVEQLKKQVAAARGAPADQLQDQLDLTQAQLELDQDEVDDAKGDLIRAGADPFSRVQRQFNRHESAEHETSQTPAAPAAQVNYQAGNLYAQFSAWRTLQEKVSKLEQARDDAAQTADTLNQAHATLSKQVDVEKAAAPSAAGASPNAPATDTKAVLKSLRQLSDDQKGLADLNKRIQDEQELQTAYSNWLAIVQSHQRNALHGMIQSALWILLIVLAVYLADRFIDRRLAAITAERTRLHTLRAVLRFAVQAVGVLCILLVVLGIPQQMPTIIGFAGAGLTVALKDFIVAFFGWFVLMGKNGLRVGDWVEINGVAGEVIEINLLRTVLLETGNWTDTGHPTGRKVAFVNSYAIEGHFFNFTTTGQWLWDELTLMIPADRDPYALLGTIEQAVAHETESSAQAAEKEWQNAAGHYRVQAVSSAPAVTIHPTSTGVEVHVRYVTRARERASMRSRLNSALVQLLRDQSADAKGNAAVAKQR